MPAATKTFSIGYGTGKTLYLIARRDLDGFLLNDADGAFADAPDDPYISLSEHATLKGLYKKDEDRTVWDDGIYTILIYAATGSPSPAADTLIGLEEIILSSDTATSSDSGGWDADASAHTASGTTGAILNAFASQYGIVT